jgi:hypothetical protein
LHGTVPLAAARGFLLVFTFGFNDAIKKTRLRSMNHAASNASKALLEVLTARGQEIKFGLKLSALRNRKFF